MPWDVRSAAMRPDPLPAFGIMVVLDRVAASPIGYRVTTAFPEIE